MIEIVPDSLPAWLAASTTPFGLVLFAEFGDKSQIVCMTLAARHRHWPVLAGTVAAFMLLNTLAVAFGAGLAHWVPERLLAAIVAALFATYGILMLTNADEDAADVATQRSNHGIFLTAFLMILVAEMGDKTQIAVAGMATSLPVVPVWIGATLALTATSALGVLAGRKLLRRIPSRRVHQVGGVLFLALAAFALTRVFD
ncbi:MAG: TMEM165/GDT1 family protein [Gammaproteobacteria bacterium]|nr:TMEM165/GDT1 family protein [Gammaproteobacteria bacterium]